MTKFYPWDKTIPEMVEFEKKNTKYITDLPTLSEAEIAQLLAKVLTPEVKVQMHLLSHAVDQANLSPDQANQVLEYLKPVYFDLISVFAALSLSPAVDSIDLVWMLQTISDMDVKDHTSHNLLKRLLPKDAPDDLA